jgi:hypothetical protein
MVAMSSKISVPKTSAAPAEELMSPVNIEIIVVLPAPL